MCTTTIRLILLGPLIQGKPYLLHQPWLKDSVDANLHAILTWHVRRLPCQKLHLDQLHSALPGRWSQTDHPAPARPEQNSNQHSLEFQHLRRITASLITMLRLNSLDVEQCKLKLQIFKFKKKEKVSSLTILQTYLNTNKLNPSTGGFRFNTDHIRLPQRFTHAVHLLRAGAAHNKVLCHHGAANQIQGADEGFKGFRI